MNRPTLAIAFALGLLPLYPLLAANPAATPEQVQAVKSKLDSTIWSWDNPDNVIKVAGRNITKDGAWTEIRFRGTDATGWRDSIATYRGQCEVLGPDLIRIFPFGDAGFVLRFNASFTSFSVENYPQISGKFLKQAPEPPRIVGKWRTGGGVIQCHEDGLVTTAGGNGRWIMLSNDKFEVKWRGGAFTDSIRIISGGRRLKYKGQENGKEGEWERITERKD